MNFSGQKKKRNCSVCQQIIGYEKENNNLTNGKEKKNSLIYKTMDRIEFSKNLLH